MLCRLTSLVVLVDFFFNSLVVGVPHSLIFWCFWLFIDFRLVVILLLVVRGSEGFPPTPPSWPELVPYLLNWKISLVVEFTLVRGWPYALMRTNQFVFLPVFGVRKP